MEGGSSSHVVNTRLTESVSDAYDNIFIPQVDNSIRPHVYQWFPSCEVAEVFYKNYAKHGGFNVRKQSTGKSKKTGELNRIEFVCSYEGYKKKKKDKPTKEKKRRRGDTRCGCGAKFAITAAKDGHWQVQIFVEPRNHPLTTPRRKHLNKIGRGISSTHKCLAQSMDVANIAPSQQMAVLEVQSQGIENLGFLHTDLYNHRRDMRKKVSNHDADILLDYFKNKKLKNPSFVYEIEATADDKLFHCFWAEAESRRSYSLFGDVVVFYTTFNTNQYSMIFSPLLGVNNHGQTIVFGCAFLSNESAESFIWLFECFKRAMPGYHPKMIITDQDLGMTKAIANCFPHTLHSWHITNKFSEKLDSETYKLWYPSFQKCIWDSLSREDFDARWMDILHASGQSEHTWLNHLLENRETWIPVYTNHVFSAGMTSSQRAESAHAFFKKFISVNNTLMDFVTRFNRGITRQRHQTLRADHIDIEERPVMMFNPATEPMEQQVARIYTRTMFYDFQKQMCAMSDYIFTLVENDLLNDVFHVRKRMDVSGRKRVVTHDKTTCKFSYSCHLFESHGILCRHVLLIFHSKEFKCLPEQYILKRWHKGLREEIVADEIGMIIQGQEIEPSLIRRGSLIPQAFEVINFACSNDEKTQFLSATLTSAMESLRIMDKNYEVTSVEKSNLSVPHVYNDPDKARPKGCGKRIKGGKEKAMTDPKPRKCSTCGVEGAGHDKRNCPGPN